METTVTAVESVGPDTIAIVFESPDDFEARPGQFVKLTETIDGETYARFYTLSSPDVEDTFEITVEIDPEEGGPFSDYLGALEAGDDVTVSGPFGNDFYEGEQHVVLLAGGPGIGPAVGIGERVVDDGGDLVIVYRDDTPAHETRLAELDAAGASVAITDGPIDEAVSAALTGEADEQVFVYGFAEFVAEAADAIEAAGGDPDAAKVENFG